jgi:hypothetical protein
MIIRRVPIGWAAMVRQGMARQRLIGRQLDAARQQLVAGSSTVNHQSPNNHQSSSIPNHQSITQSPINESSI